LPNLAPSVKVVYKFSTNMIAGVGEKEEEIGMQMTVNWSESYNEKNRKAYEQRRRL